MRFNFPVAASLASLALVASVLVGTGGSQLAATDVPGTVHFTASGDFSSSTNARNVLSGIASIDPDLHLALGDLSYGQTGQEQAWCDLVTSRLGAGFPFELLAGNHESNGQNGNINDFSACLPNQLPGVVGTYGRQYFVDVPADAPLVRYVMISPAIPFPDGVWSYAAGSPRYDWTAAAVDGARAANIPWVIVGMHKPCMSIGAYVCEVGDDLINMLIAKRVDLVLAGHEHLYQRTHQLATTAACPAVASGTVNTGCIADSDTTMVKDAGTVFTTIGTGGVELRPINTADSEVGYFGAWSGSNASPSFGSLDVSVTATELTASFAAVAGGTFADGFTLGPAGPTTNLSPVASFTVACDLLDCAADASASSDPDGTVASYAWNFGDGTTASGQTASHSYETEGSRTITLTVTDDAGATNTTTRVAQPTSPPPPPPPPSVTLAADDFERSVVNAWGTATNGGPWTISTTPSRYSVSGGMGKISVSAGSGPNAYLTGPSSTATVLTTTISTDKAASGSGLYVSLAPRRVVGAGTYAAKVRLTSNGQVWLEPIRANATGGGEVSLQSAIVVPGVSHTAGAAITVKVEVSGTSPTTIRAKAWLAGTTEPAAWQRSATDATAGLQTAGGLGINVYLSGSATNAPIRVAFDNLDARVP